MSKKQTVAEILLNLKAVSLRTNPPYKWASGILSPIYTDNRILISYPKERDFIVDSFLKLLDKNKVRFDGFAGTAAAGIPWASFLALKTKKPMVFVRSHAKDHGRENLIEGIVEKGRKYVVVEDLVSTGGSSINAINALRNAGGAVESCIAIFTYELSKSESGFENARCRLYALTGFTELIGAAAKKKYINSAQKSAIMKWKENPQGWSA